MAVRPVHGRLSLVLGLVAGGSIAAVILLEAFWGEWRLVSEPLHAAVEALGALAAILTALFLVQGERGQRRETLFFPAMGFLAMGLLELLHATASGHAVVFLRGAASVAGGLGFALAWLRLAAPSVATAWKKPLAGFVAAASILLGVWGLAATDSPPLMLRDGRFTGMAIGLNVSAGMLFLAGAARLAIDSRTLAGPIIPLFATVAALFGAAGLMSPFSTLWDSDWWTWHLVRLAAYLLALVFMVREHQRSWRHRGTRSSPRVTVCEPGCWLAHSGGLPRHPPRPIEPLTLSRPCAGGGPSRRFGAVRRPLNPAAPGPAAGWPIRVITSG